MDFTKAHLRAKEIVCKMTAEEKLSQLLYDSPAIERLGIKEYNWWNEAAHGVARAGVATVFPQAIGMAATFNPSLINQVADAVSTEARAKYNKSVQFGDYDIYKGLTFWTPNINIFRDPRWGRGQETFGECPFLTTKIANAYIDGLQGNGEFLKSAACSKHFAVHSGPEALRHSFDAKADMKDMWETFLPAFEKTVENGVAGVMGAYNRTNGDPCCAHSYLMQDVLFNKWGFKGYFVSDCGAINDISENHHYAPTKKEGAAVALKRGCNLNCGSTYKYLVDAYEEDLITDEDLDRAVESLYTIRVMLGEFEESRPFSDVSYDKLDCDEHRALNLKAAQQSLVLLKNESEFLPISDGQFKKIAVIGPNANSVVALEGNYNGHASKYVTVADGMREEFERSKILVASGSLIALEKPLYWEGFGNMRSEGLATASEADLTVLCLGLDRNIEGEEMTLNDEFAYGGDRKTVSLPKTQIELANEICDVAKNLVVVVLSGSSVDLGEKVNSHAKAIVHAWYPGALGGLAIAQLIKGEFSPSGKLPVTFYKNTNTLPEFTDYSMKNRTYRFITETPLYPFGFGLGFKQAQYKDAKVVCCENGKIKLSVNVINESNFKVTEKMQVYAQFDDNRTATPNFQLCGINAVDLEPKEEKTVEIQVDSYWIKAVLENGERVEPNGDIWLFVGSHQPDSLSESLTGTKCVKVKLN